MDNKARMEGAIVILRDTAPDLPVAVGLGAMDVAPSVT